MSEEPFKSRWTIYPQWIEGMDTADILRNATPRILSIAEKCGVQMFEPKIKKCELISLLDNLCTEPDKLRMSMLKNFCRGNISDIGEYGDEDAIKEVMYKIIRAFDYRYYMARIVMEYFWSQLNDFRQGDLSPIDYLVSYNRAIIVALGNKVSMRTEEVERDLSLYLRGQLINHDGGVMLELYDEILEILFPGESEFKKTCLQADRIFTQARSDMKTEQNKKRCDAIPDKDKREAMDILKMMRERSVSQKNEETIK